jgi:hypothetical protein
MAFPVVESSYFFTVDIVNLKIDFMAVNLVYNYEE